MSRRVIKGKGKLMGRYNTTGKSRKGPGGHKTVYHQGPEEPGGYRRLRAMPKHAKAAQPHEESHPGHRMLASGHRAHKLNFGR